MTGFNHGMTGAVIALAVKNPAIAIPLSFASHYLADFIPHYGFKQKEVLKREFNIFLVFDFALAVICMAVLGFLFPHSKFLIWGCMTAAALPDAVWWFYRRTVKDWPRGLDKFTAWHFKIGNRAHTSHLNYDAAWFGLVWAIVIAVKVK